MRVPGPGESLAGRGMKLRRYRVAAGAVLLLALALRLATHVGIRTFEPVFTAHSAHEILEGRHEPQKHMPGAVNHARFGMTLPTALAAAVGGWNDAACTLWPLLCGMLTLALALVLGPATFGPRASLAAGALLAALPADVLWSTQLYSDVPMALFWSGAAFAFWRAIDLRCRYLALLAGFLVGLSWMLREPGPILLVVLLAWAAPSRAWRLWSFAAAAAAAVFLAECVYYIAAAGDPFYRLGIMTRGIHARYMATEYYPTAGSVWSRVFLDLPSMMFNPWDPAFAYTAGLPILAAGSALAMGRKGWADEPYRRLLLWAMIVFVAFAALPLSVFPFRPAMVLLVRTLVAFTVPLAFLAGSALSRVRWGLPAAAAAALVGAALTIGLAGPHRDAQAESRLALRVLDAVADPVIVTDDLFSANGHRANFIAFSRGFDPRVAVYSLKDADPSTRDGVYVLVNTLDLARTAPVYPPGRLDLVLAPPPSWERLYRKDFSAPGDPAGHHAAVYRVRSP